VELLWHNGSIVAQPQAHHKLAPPSNRDRLGTSGLTAEETAAWFPDTLDDPLEKDLYTQLWYSTIADAAPQHEGTFRGPTSHPSSSPPPVGSSGVESSWADDICLTFCGNNQVPRTPTGIRGRTRHCSRRCRAVSARTTAHRHPVGLEATMGDPGCPVTTSMATRGRGCVETSHIVGVRCLLLFLYNMYHE
jgi:hypothetical protein